MKGMATIEVMSIDKSPWAPAPGWEFTGLIKTSKSKVWGTWRFSEVHAAEGRFCVPWQIPGSALAFARYLEMAV